MITKIDFFTPKIDYSNTKLKKVKNLKKIIEITGIDKKFSCKKNEYGVDLAIKAAKKILRNENKKTIDFMIICTQSPKYALPGDSSFIQNEIFKEHHVPSIDINLGCSGYIYCLCIADSLIYAGNAKKILLITYDTYSKYIFSKSKNTRYIFGDGASASIIEKKNKKKYFFNLGTDGSGASDLIVPDNFYYGKKKEIIMNGQNVFNFTINQVPKSILETLNKNKMNINDINMFIFHQANKKILSTLGSLLKIPKKKIFYNLKNFGNITSSTIPVALFQAIKKKRIRSGDKVLLSGFGVGLSWSSTIIKINPCLIKYISNLK